MKGTRSPYGIIYQEIAQRTLPTLVPGVAAPLSCQRKVWFHGNALRGGGKKTQRWRGRA